VTRATVAPLNIVKQRTSNKNSTIMSRPSSKFPCTRLAVLLLLVVCAPGSTLLRGQIAKDETFAQFDASIKPLLGQYCAKCHSAEKHKGDVNFEQFVSLSEIRRQPKIWQLAFEQITTGDMPPADKPQPTAAERERLTAWIRSQLGEMAAARAGDPGPVVLRRLSNAEYTATLRDLTGVPTLDPAREFPIDGAAGEGFMNTGNALVMSPSLLTKYLDAGKDVASHAVLLPDGVRFSSKATRRDWADQLLGEIKGFYGRFTDADGKIPLAKYLAATLECREALVSGKILPAQAATERGLNPKYFTRLWDMLEEEHPSLVLASIQSEWRQSPKDGAVALAGEIGQWQKSLWKFQNVGHMKPWMLEANPVADSQELWLKLAPSPGASEVRFYLSVSPAGPGGTNSTVLWRRPRLVAPGHPDLSLRDARAAVLELTARRDRLFAGAARCLAAAADPAAGATNVAELAGRFGVESESLSAWLNYLGMGPESQVRINSFFTNRIESSAGFDFVKGWGTSETPLLVANSSDQHVRIPGNMKPHSVALHPSPTLRAAVGWRSPVNASLRIDGRVTRAHPECGPGITWSLELRRGASRQRLAGGAAGGADDLKIGPVINLPVREGDLVSLLIGPRDGGHACGLTAVDLTLSTTNDATPVTWNLAQEVSGNVLAGNPHADGLGHPGVWQFYTEPDKGGVEQGPAIPAGSLLARWQIAGGAEEKTRLAGELQALLNNPAAVKKGSPDESLYRQLAALRGPLLGLGQTGLAAAKTGASINTSTASPASDWGLDPSLFGSSPDGTAIDPDSLAVKAPWVAEIRLPADLVEGCEFVTTGVLRGDGNSGGAAQFRVSTSKPASPAKFSADAPVVVAQNGDDRKRVENAFDDFRQLFPAALCYNRIVPVDEVITLTLFHREDDHFCRLMLEPSEKAKLDRLWEELHFITRDALTVVDAFAQLLEYASQDGDPRIFEPLRKPINQRAADFRRQMTNSEPAHVEFIVNFASGAYRRPLTATEQNELRELYRNLRREGLPHDEAFRLTLARVLVSPSFLYRMEKPGPGKTAAPVSAWELATRLSYFLWSSAPDAALRDAAMNGSLLSPETLQAQTRRMLRDGRTRRLAVEFGCQWLHVHDFDELDEKSEKFFPTFASARGPMYEESILLFQNLFQHNESVLDLLDANYTFLNEDLAKHYDIPGVKGPEWRRVDDVRQYGRGGILGLGATLAKQSGASRTSPILRGNWVCEVLLGEKLPRPPKDVPRLPEDETATAGLTVRQLVEKHSTDPKCARCHVRIDAYGYSLEAFDAIGRHREKDLAGRLIETKAKVMDGTEFTGLDGLRNYLSNQRRDVFLRQFCRKLLGYSLGRATLLSDEPLLQEMVAKLKANDYRIESAIDAIVSSQQFREIRGIETAYEE
jgi:hypothetical protein